MTNDLPPDLRDKADPHKDEGAPVRRPVIDDNGIPWGQCPK